MKCGDTVYNLGGKLLGKCIGNMNINSKGELIFLVEGSEGYTVGTSKTMFTVRTVDRHFVEQKFELKSAEGSKVTMKKLSWGK